MGRQVEKKLIGLEHPRHVYKPEDLLDFIELPQFTKRWQRLGLDDEDDLAALQLSIMADPRGAQVIRGTNGIRKMRFAPAKWNTGASGAVRVLYRHFDAFGIVLLCLAYGKSELDNISPAVKQQLSKLVREIERELERRRRL